MKITLLISFLIAVTAHADVVKVIGTNCHTKTSISNGSGIVFLMDQQQYVLSSDHVTPGQNQRCYIAQSVAGQRTGLILISSDWESGLSLLKVKDQLSNVHTGLEDFHSNPDSKNVVAVGFPAASSQLLSDSARVAMSRSDRTPFVSTDNMIEIVGAQIEFGMSGGALFSAEDGKIIGMISHQRLILIPGQSTQIESNSKQKENHGLVISSSEIVPWIRKNADAPAIYSQVGEASVQGAGILFRESKNILVAAAKGGDGVGVGGGESESNSVSIEISVSALDQFNVKAGMRPELDWVRQILPQLIRNGSISVNAMLILNTETETIEKVSIKSTAQFIKLMRSGSAIPIVKNLPPAAGLTELRSDLSVATDNLELKTLKSLLLSLVDVKSQYGVVSVPKNYLNTLQNHPGWKAFFDENFELAVKAKTFSLSL